MFKLSRLRNYSVGLLVGFVLSFGVGFPLWTSASEADRAIRNKSIQALNGASAAYIANGSKCNEIFVPAERLDCAEQTSEDYYKLVQSERDLEAQQLMANWTRVMGKAAIIGMAVGLIGLILVFVTFWETRKAADAGRQSNDIARQQQRARIVPFARWVPANVLVSQIVIACENLGLSPALNLRCAIKVDLEAPKYPPQFEEWGERRTVKASGEADLTAADERVLDGVIVGCIQYDTIYSKGMRTFFCLRFEQSPRDGSWYAIDCTPDTWPENS